MKNLTRSMYFVLCITLLCSAQLLGQKWSEEQKEVLSIVEAQWKASMEKDATWPDKFLHNNFLGWSNDNPMPRDKSSIKKWERYDSENSTTLLFELYPLGIAMQGNTAVVHYFYSHATESKKDGRKTVVGYFTDILVKENGTWQFLAWQGGEKPTND
jgi:hypothetical protein